MSTIKAKAMPLSILTYLPTPLAALSTAVSTLGGIVFGNEFGGISGAAIGGILAGGGTLIGIILTALITLRKQNTDDRRQNIDGAITIDRERDAILERSNELHARELAVMQQQHAAWMSSLQESHARDKELAGREKDFLRGQVIYHEQLEKVTRERLHAMVGEVQTSVNYIGLIEITCRQKEFVLDLPPFEVKNYDDIVKMFPLPAAPATDSHT